MRTAIFCEPGDYHAAAIAWGLKRKGHACDRLYPSDLPQRGTFSHDPTSSEATVIIDEQEFSLASYRTILMRRPADPVLPHHMHEADRLAAKSFWEIALTGAYWQLQSNGIHQSGPMFINPLEGAANELMKPYHLGIAVKCGLTIPPTLISSHAEHVKSFIAKNSAAGQRSIVKALRSVTWDFGDSAGMALCDTSYVNIGDIDPASLKLAPCIFQSEVEKQYEVRVTVMGGTMIAATLDSQKFDEARLDYRRITNWKRLGCDQIDVPPDVTIAIKRFQTEAKLNFGTMDFIVDLNGDWIFLETNPMGNFLWIENVNPKIQLLDAMCDFIISGDEDFIYTPGERAVHLADFLPHNPNWSSQKEEESHVLINRSSAVDAPLYS